MSSHQDDGKRRVDDAHAALDRVREMAIMHTISAHARGRGDDARNWQDVLRIIERATDRPEPPL